mmetsp:Transcript_34781/g.48220  ORF Transcript_34781/g.48220 Transcript_34781/m.48220 type:complete len:214 (+) Transcript_34781:821-1462(+)
MLFKSAVLVAALAVVAYVGIGHESQYVFTPEAMHAIAKEAIEESPAGDLNQIFDSVVRKLNATHPDYIIDNPKWLFNNAGGAMGSMLVLHCSFSEYVIIFGSAVGTEGHTGRFLAHDYFTILYGEQWAYSAGDVKREVYYPGDQHYLPLGTAKQYKFPEDCWALEYARGNIISMLPFGILDTLCSTMDLVTLGQTIYVSVKWMLYNALVNGKI